MVCPNKNSEEWRRLVEMHGEEAALVLYNTEAVTPSFNEPVYNAILTAIRRNPVFFRTKYADFLGGSTFSEELMARIFYSRFDGLNARLEGDSVIVENLAQQSNKIEIIPELEERLVKGFLKDFNIEVKEYTSIKNDLGFDALSMSDLVTKFIAYQEGESFTGEVAYFAYNMLGKQNNKIKSNLRYLISKWDRFNERFDYHKKIINREEGFIEDSKEWKNKIKDLVILDFLQEKLILYYKNPTAFEKLNDSK